MLPKYPIRFQAIFSTTWPKLWVSKNKRSKNAADVLQWEIYAHLCTGKHIYLTFQWYTYIEKKK